MQGRRVLFIISSAESHYRASFRIACFLKSAGYDTCYAGEPEFRSLVKANGFRFVEYQSSNLIVREHIGKSKLSTYLNLFLDSVVASCSGRASEVLQSAEYELKRVVGQVNPTLVIIDSFLSLHCCCLEEYQGRILILQTMLSTTKSKSIPPLTSGFVTKKKALYAAVSSFLWFLYFQRRNIDRLAIKLLLLSMDPKSYLLSRSQSLNVTSKRCFHSGFTEVPEILTSPVELDYPWVQLSKNQFHIGPLIDSHRKEINSDTAFNSTFDTFLQKMKPNAKLVYCSLGTISDVHNGRVGEFLSKLTKAISRVAHLSLVISTGGKPGNIKLASSTNVLVFSRVPQLEVLRKSDLFITHGGLNSILESVLIGVPLLVFPLGSKWDQRGNSARVLYHQLGDRGTLSDNESSILAKIDSILDNSKIKANVAHFSSLMQRYCKLPRKLGH